MNRLIWPLSYRPVSGAICLILTIAFLDVHVQTEFVQMSAINYNVFRNHQLKSKRIGHDCPEDLGRS